MERERTGWYPPQVNPARVGIYERDLGTIGIRWAYWNGSFWGGFANEVRNAVANRHSPTAHPVAPWRGLAARHR